MEPVEALLPRDEELIVPVVVDLRVEDALGQRGRSRRFEEDACALGFDELVAVARARRGADLEAGLVTRAGSPSALRPPSFARVGSG